MNTIQIVNAFLGFSVAELTTERQSVSTLADDIVNLFSLDNIAVRFLGCEKKHSSIIGDNEQVLIDKTLRECDISLFLFKNRVDKWTQHEFDVASALQKERKQRIFVYFLRTPEEEKENSLRDFRQRLDADGFIWNDCDTLSDVKFNFSMGLLAYLGISIGTGMPESETTGKRSDAHNELYVDTRKYQEQARAEMHKRIDDLLEQLPTILESPTKSIATKILYVIDVYKKADHLAQKCDYDKEKYCGFLFDYADFLYKYGMYRDAEDVFLRQRCLSEELYGPDNHATATSYNNIGLVYDAMGDYPRALDYYGKALEIQEKVLGVDHPDTAAAYNNIGSVYWNTGEYLRALKYYGKALEIREKVLGSDHPDTAQSYNNIGSVFYAMGNYSRALDYYGKAWAIRESVLGTNHPATATSYNNIGSVYHKMEDYPRALEYYSKALAIMENVLGTNHPDAANSYNNIGSVYNNLGEYHRALEYFTKALAIREKVLGPDHPVTATSYNNIGALYLQMKEYSKASEYLEKALTKFKVTLGEKHPYTQGTMEWLQASKSKKIESLKK